jgi:deoxycytidylate deaminase
MEQYALNIASTAAERSEDIYQKVGACALNEKNMVIAVGYNGLAPGRTLLTHSLETEAFVDPS